MEKIKNDLKEKRKNIRVPWFFRSEMEKAEIDPDRRLDWSQWLLRAGALPEANGPVSQIGIYTDFT